MSKQNQQKPQQNEQQQPKSQRGGNPDQQGGRNAQGQSGNFQQSQGQPGARQSDQGGNRESSSRANDAPKGSQRGQTANQQGTRPTVDESPEMNEGGDQSSSERLRRGALDAQYGTDSSSKTGERGIQSEDSQSPTGSDRDSMGGSRSEGR